MSSGSDYNKGASAPLKSSLASGWILVTGLLVLCVIGSGLTWWNYSSQVFSSANGVVVNDGNESRIVVSFPSGAARVIKAGHGATITVGEDKHPLKGQVVSVNPSTQGEGDSVLIRLVDAPSLLPNGAICSVTIDTTIPPQ